VSLEEVDVARELVPPCKRVPAGAGPAGTVPQCFSWVLRSARTANVLARALGARKGLGAVRALVVVLHAHEGLQGLERGVPLVAPAPGHRAAVPAPAKKEKEKKEKEGSAPGGLREIQWGQKGSLSVSA